MLGNRCNYIFSDKEYDGPSTTAKGGAMIAPPQSLIMKDKETMNVLHPEVRVSVISHLLT